MRTGIVVCVRRPGWSGLHEHSVAAQRQYARKFGYQFRAVDLRRAEAATLLQALEADRADGADLLVLDNSSSVTARAPAFVEALSAVSANPVGAASCGGEEPPLLYLRGGPGAGSEVVAALSDPERLASLVAELGLQDPSLPSTWDWQTPEGHEDAFVLRYVGSLRRQARTGGEAVSLLSTPFAAETRTDHELRARYYMTRRAIRQSGAWQTSADFEAFKVAVADLARTSSRRLPRLPVDDPRAWIWRHEYLNRTLEAPSAEILRRIAATARVAVDGGAHVGYYAAEVIAAKNPDCLVLAVEPHPENVAALRHNCQGMNVRVVQAALADVDGSAVLHDGRGHSNSTLVEGAPTSGASFPVDTVRIDSLFARHGLHACDIIKLDVEGFEVDALRGAAETIAASPDVVLLLELNPSLLGLRGGAPLTQMHSLMKTYGLKGRMVRDDFSLGPVGFIDHRNTMNYVFARPHRWKSLTKQLTAHEDLTP